MNPDKSVGKVSLHSVLEVEDIVVADNKRHNLLVARTVGGFFAHVAAETARIVAQAIGLWVRRNACEGRLDGAERYGPAAKLSASESMYQ
jgi:hypothetical protein